MGRAEELGHESRAPSGTAAGRAVQGTGGALQRPWWAVPTLGLGRVLLCLLAAGVPKCTGSQTPPHGTPGFKIRKETSRDFIWQRSSNHGA